MSAMPTQTHADTAFDAVVAEITAVRRDLHAHPETAFEEHRTAALVADRLRAWGLEVHTGIGKTGVVGVLRNGAGPTIGLRADMDALPISEANDFAHRSRHDGRMHACGHDGHTALLLGAARQLSTRPAFAGTVCFIFQPAEEQYGGGKAMLEDGLLDRFPIERFYGLHNWPGLAAGSFAVVPGPVMAASDEFEIVIEGRGAHGAMPHLGADPVLAGTAIVQALQSILTRNLDPLDAGVISVTRFQAGHAYNVIPRQAVLGGTARSLRPEVQQQIETGMQRIGDGIAAAHGVAVKLTYRRGYPATFNDLHEAEFCRRVAGEVVGRERLVDGLRPSMGSEDFAFFAQVRPACYVWLGNGPGEGGCMLHSPYFDFNDALIPIGMRYWTRLVETALPAARPAP